MGCGSSAPAQTPRGELKNRNSPAKQPLPHTLKPNGKPKKSVAFNISLDNDCNNVVENDIESILRKPLPLRLQHLAPLENAPKLTAEMLDEKLKQAEEKRLGVLEERKQPGRKVSRRHSELQQAKEFAATNVDQLNEKLLNVEKMRNAKLADIQAKQRIREERRQRARERAQKLKESGINDLDYEIEHSETISEQTNVESNRNEGEWCLENKVDSDTKPPLSSGYNSRDNSASSGSSGKDVHIDNKVISTEDTIVASSRGSSCKTNITMTSTLDHSDEENFFD